MMVIVSYDVSTVTANGKSGFVRLRRNALTTVREYRTRF